jgi:hypothetical protein
MNHVFSRQSSLYKKYAYFSSEKRILCGQLVLLLLHRQLHIAEHRPRNIKYDRKFILRKLSFLEPRARAIRIVGENKRDD